MDFQKHASGSEPTHASGVARTLYLGEELEVVFYDYGSDTVVYTFSELPGRDKIRESGPNLFMRAGLSAINIIPTTRHWWQTAEMFEALPLARAAGRGFRHRVTYGTSMGAFGALLWSGALNATRIIAIAPQVSMSDDVYVHSDWPSRIGFRPIIYDDVPGAIPPDVIPRVLYDPRNRQDRSQVKWLAQRRELRLDPLPFAGHKILLTLREMGHVSKVAERLFKDDITSVELRTLFRENRKLSESYNTTIRRAIDRRLKVERDKV